LPHFTKSTALSLEGCSLDDVVEYLPKTSRNLFQFILNRLLFTTPELSILPVIDGSITRYGSYALSPFNNLQHVGISLPAPPPTWAHLPTSPWNSGGDLIPAGEVRHWYIRIQMTKRDVKNLTDDLKWPECRRRRFLQYIRNQPTYESAKSLAGTSMASGYRAAITLFAAFRCEQSDRPRDGWGRSHGVEGEYFVLLHLQYDMCDNDVLLRAHSVPTYRNGVDEIRLEYE